MGADVLAIAYGITVAMWAVAYVCRLPVVEAPSAVVAILALVVPIAGGWIAGARHAAALRAGGSRAPRWRPRRAP